MSGVVVIGATGGCGATTLACGLALARVRDGAACLLVDADVHGGGPMALWGIEAARGLDDLSALGGQIGPGQIDHLVHRHASGVDVMACCAPVGSHVVRDPHIATAVAAHVAAHGTWVADGGRGGTALCSALVGHADRVLLVTPRTIEGVARAAAAAGTIEGASPVAVASGIGVGRGVRASVVARALGTAEVVEAPRDDRGAADVASARAPRGRGIARMLGQLGGVG